MSRLTTATVASALLILGGCGSGGKDGRDVLSTLEGGDAEAIAKIISQEPCEPKLTDAPREGAATGDDIVGIYPGQSAADAAAILACRGNMAEILVERTALPGMGDGPQRREALHATAGIACEMPRVTTYSGMFERGYGEDCGTLSVEGSQPHRYRHDRFRVMLVGLPGQERVSGVWRTQTFPEGARPVAEDLAQSLMEKYGEPTRTREYGNIGVVTWVQDLRGRPMSESNPAFGSCFGLDADADSNQRWTAACGQTVEVQMELDRNNPGLISQMSVVSMHQAGQIQAQEEMESALVALREKQRGMEVDRARQGAGKVEL